MYAGPQLHSPLMRWYALKRLSRILPRRLLGRQFLSRESGQPIKRAEVSKGVCDFMQLFQ